MNLKAVLFDFNGVIINDEAIHQELIADILLGENLRSDDYDFERFCLGRSDRDCLRDILKNRGRIVAEDYLTELINKKAIAYQQRLAQLKTLPIYPGLTECLSQLQEQQLIIGLVTGALKQEAIAVLEQIDLACYFSVVIGGGDVPIGKPEPGSYLVAVRQINQQHPQLNLLPQECLVIEDSYMGIEAAKRARMQVVGISHTHPLHMLQRRANWTIDYLSDLELDRINQVLSAI